MRTMIGATTTRTTTMVRAAARSTEAHVVLAIGVQSAAAILFALLTARWLGPSSRGVVVVLMTTATFLMLVGSFGISTGSRVLLNDSPPLGLARYLRQARALSLIHVVSSSTVGLLALAKTGGMPTPWIGMIFVPFAALQLLCYFQREALHGIGRHRSAMYGDVLASTLQAAAVLVLQVTGRLSLVAVCLVILGGALAQTVFLTTRLRLPEQSPPFAVFSIRQLMRYSLPALVTTLGQAFVIRGDRLILGLIAGTAPVGIYGAAASFTEMLWLIPGGVAQVAFRRASVTGTRTAGATARRITMLITVLASLALAACTRPIVTIVLGPAYADAVGLAYILIVASLPMASYQLDVAVLNGLGRLSRSGHATTLGTAILALGCVATIPTYGAYGAAWSSLAAYTAMAALAHWYVRQVKPSDASASDAPAENAPAEDTPAENAHAEDSPAGDSANG
jgi:O-antigen/teichoic acid export membrane protein